ncbi:MAG: hypothetical protein EHM91_13085 [Planctomycetota bacterium]|nr:MAG: hypothetical protein EHM91_13085 [Planctomycetota bacterium]
MRKVMSGIVLLPLLVAAAAFPQDKKDRGKTPELTKKYVAHMKANAAAMKALHKDIEDGKPEADLKKHLAVIRDNVTKAQELKYRKDEEEQDKLDRHFEIFLLKLKIDFENVEWGDKEKRLFLHERVQAKCDVCHEVLRDE